MEGMCGEITRLLSAAPTDKDSSLSTGRGVTGGWSAVNCLNPLGICLLLEDTPFPPFPPGLNSGVVTPSDSPLAYSYHGDRSNKGVE